MLQPIDALARAIASTGSPVCVGLDPVLESLPHEVRARHHEPLGAIAEFSRAVLKSIAGIAPAVKFQSACFERYGSRGMAILEEACAEALDLGLIIIWDAKRGDIGTTSAHYAAAAKRLGAHFITVNGYLGRSGLQPFIDAGLGVFVLVRTSNPDSDAVQACRLSDGRSVGELLADEVADLGTQSISREPHALSNVGAVVGATKSGEAKALRARMPNTPFLIPGYGAQGGKPDDIRDMIRRTPSAPTPARGHEGILVTASSSVIYPTGQHSSWTSNIRAAATQLAAEIAAVVRA